jgi:hypothetical protein
LTMVPFIRTDELSEKKFMPMHSSAVIRESMRLIILFVFFFSSFVPFGSNLISFGSFLSSSVFFFCFLLFLFRFFPSLHVQQVTKLAGNPLANLAALGLGGLTGTSGSGVNPSGMYHCT